MKEQIFPNFGKNIKTNCLLKLSNGGSDASIIREFDLINKKFIDNNGFNVDIVAKTTARYKDESLDTLIISTSFPNEKIPKTKSGYPRVVKE